MIPQAIKYCMFFILLLNILGSSSMAQDTEQKDIPEIITIYIKLDMLIDCEECAIRLEKEIKKIDGAENIKVDLEEQTCTFDMLSNKVIPKDNLEHQLKKAKFIILNIEYSKEPIEEEIPKIKKKLKPL